MAELSQIQISFSDSEDRLLLRISTTDDEEFRFWLTRRFSSRLFPLMVDTIQAIPDIASQRNATNREAVMDFQQEQATQNADFSTPFSIDAEKTVYPLGEEAVLVVRGHLVQHSTDMFNLSLKDADDVGIDFNFNTDILYLLHKLLRDSLDATDWGLSLAMPSTATISHQNRTLN
jgi:hypothetical protein